MTVDPRALVEEAIRKAQEHAKPPAPLQWLDMSNWDNEPVPERKWAIRDRVPLRQTGLFSGEGGTGKSILELTKNVAHVVGKDWLGSLPEIGPAFYLGAEDDVDELHIRLAAIVEHYGTTFAELTDNGLHVLPLLGKDAVLCAGIAQRQSRDYGASISKFSKLPATSSRRTFRLTRSLAPSPATK